MHDGVFSPTTSGHSLLQLGGMPHALAGLKRLPAQLGAWAIRPRLLRGIQRRTLSFLQDARLLPRQRQYAGVTTRLRQTRYCQPRRSVAAYRHSPSQFDQLGNDRIVDDHEPINLEGAHCYQDADECDSRDLTEEARTMIKRTRWLQIMIFEAAASRLCATTLSWSRTRRRAACARCSAATARLSRPKQRKLKRGGRLRYGHQH